MKKLTTEEFIKKAQYVHGDEYSYKKVIYKNSTTKVCILCKKHGYFNQAPSKHLFGQGCPVCRFKKISINKTKSNKDFILESKKAHGDLYDYTKTEYKAAKTNVTIICKIHGEFQQLPTHHIRGAKCPKCMGNKLLTKKEFIDRANEKHSYKYDYSKIIFKNTKSKLIIICKKHGEFKQSSGGHLYGNGCPKCKADTIAKIRTQDSSVFLKRANAVHDLEYQYDIKSYGGMREKLRIKCLKHGWFEQIADNHLRGHGCPKCTKKAEGRVAELLIKKDILFKEYRIKDKYFDFYLPKYNLLIERDGEQHYGSKNFARFIKISLKELIELQQKNDKYKTKLAIKEGFKIARLPYWLTKKEEEIEIENILAGKPTYPDIPDLKQEKTKPRPKKNY